LYDIPIILLLFLLIYTNESDNIEEEENMSLRICKNNKRNEYNLISLRTIKSLQALATMSRSKDPVGIQQCSIGELIQA
jgi:hypothetical protein